MSPRLQHRRAAPAWPPPRCGSHPPGPPVAKAAKGPGSSARSRRSFCPPAPFFSRSHPGLPHHLLAPGTRGRRPRPARRPLPAALPLPLPLPLPAPGPRVALPLPPAACATAGGRGARAAARRSPLLTSPGAAPPAAAAPPAPPPAPPPADAAPAPPPAAAPPPPAAAAPPPAAAPFSCSSPLLLARLFFLPLPPFWFGIAGPAAAAAARAGGRRRLRKAPPLPPAHGGAALRRARCGRRGPGGDGAGRAKGVSRSAAPPPRFLLEQALAAARSGARPGGGGTGLSWAERGKRSGRGLLRGGSPVAAGTGAGLEGRCALRSREAAVVGRGGPRREREGCEAGPVAAGVRLSAPHRGPSSSMVCTGGVGGRTAAPLQRTAGKPPRGAEILKIYIQMV